MLELRTDVKYSILGTMEMLKRSATKRRGRPLSFDREKALDAATLQFWRTGYETTSVSDLTQAMGITAPSLYTAFGDKESLFLECLEKYANPGPKTTPQLISDAPSARQAAQELLEVSAREGRLPKTANAQALASMTMALIQGMSTLARDGAGQKALLDLARTAMNAWPVNHTL